MNLKNKVIVITGASRGLGKAMGLGFARNGAKLVLSSRSKKDIQQFAKSINAIPVIADVTNEKQVIELANTAIKKFGKIDIWINNAGVWVPHAPVKKLDTKRVHEMVEVNLFGTIYGSKAAIIRMLKQRHGVIINILSTSALKGRAGSSGYVASKYGATGFTNSLRLEIKSKNIYIISVYPGGMRTNLFNERKPKDYNKYMNPNFVAQKIINNLKRKIPREELIIKRK